MEMRGNHAIPGSIFGDSFSKHDDIKDGLALATESFLSFFQNRNQHPWF
jgi:hypothetical protein